MKNASYYIQYQYTDTKSKHTKTEIFRNILCIIGQLLGCIAMFAIMYAITILASVF